MPDGKHIAGDSQAQRIIAYHARIYAPDGNLLTTYRDHYDRLAIGYDHTRSTTDGQTITETEARALLASDLDWLAGQIEKLTEYALLTGYQLAALLSFGHSLPFRDFTQTTVLARIRCRRLDEVGAEMLKHSAHGTRTLQTLTKRRASEAALWARSL